jgi:hypothetical protein
MQADENLDGGVHLGLREHSKSILNCNGKLMGSGGLPIDQMAYFRQTG